MARSARELFEEAMKLDPQERSTLVRLLIEALNPNGVDEAWRAEIEHRMADLTSVRSRQFPGKRSELGCTVAEWVRQPSGSILLQRRRRNRPDADSQLAISPLPALFARSWDDARATGGRGF